MKNTENILFKEEQQFRQIWLWAILIGSFILSVAGILLMAFTGEASDNEIWLMVLIILPVEICFLSLFYYAKLETIISTSEVQFRWWPVMKKYKVINWQDIKVAQLKKGPLFHRGFSLVPGYGFVHNISPGKGLQLITKRGKKIFLGTQKPSALQHAIDKALTHLQFVK